MTAHDKDKSIALLKSIAADCEAGDEHAWRKCRHCLAVAELDERGVREMLREFLATLSQRQKV